MKKMKSKLGIIAKNRVKMLPKILKCYQLKKKGKSYFNSTSFKGSNAVSSNFVENIEISERKGSNAMSLKYNENNEISERKGSNASTLPEVIDYIYKNCSDESF